MIISRTPLRICLGGGGTDVKDYYEKHGGFVVSAAMNQYIYIAIHKHFEKNIRLCYSKKEIVQSSDEVQHPVVHEAMKLFGIEGAALKLFLLPTSRRTPASGLPVVLRLDSSQPSLPIKVSG